jgi:hypothetical protein
MWFLWDGRSVLLFSLPKTRKVRNIEVNSTVVLALDAADQGYDVVIVDGRPSSPHTGTARFDPLRTFASDFCPSQPVEKSGCSATVRKFLDSAKSSQRRGTRDVLGFAWYA